MFDSSSSGDRRMFENLLESKVSRQRSWRQGLLSVAAHGLVIFAAVKATQSAAEIVHSKPNVTKMEFLKPPDPSPPAPASAPPPPANAVITVNPPPKGFKTIVPPTDIPKDIPPIDLNEKPFDPKDYTGVGQEGGSSTGSIGGTGSGDGVAAGIGSGGGGVYAMGDLDDPVQIIHIDDPRYPPALKSMGIEGAVDLRYIVDTTGHAEPNSFQVLNPKEVRPEFISPAKEAILKGVFKPAKFRGRPVRQLVQQRVKFQVR
jgi:periplasmic protein TonB